MTAVFSLCQTSVHFRDFFVCDNEPFPIPPCTADPLSAALTLQTFCREAFSWPVCLPFIIEYETQKQMLYGTDCDMEGFWRDECFGSPQHATTALPGGWWCCREVQEGVRKLKGCSKKVENVLGPYCTCPWLRTLVWGLFVPFGEITWVNPGYNYHTEGTANCPHYQCRNSQGAVRAETSSQKAERTIYW